MHKTYIFDYGGTLDTGGDHWGRVIWHAYERAGIPVGEEQFREAYVFAERKLGSEPIIKPSFTFRETLHTKLQIEMEHLGINEGLTKVLDDLYALTQKQTAASREVLLKLRETATLALVSNFYGNLDTVLQEFHLDNIFDVVVESATVGIRKPDPAIYKLALELIEERGKATGRRAKLGNERREERGDAVTVIGDSMKNDIQPAKELGLYTIQISGEPWDNINTTGISADRVITNLKELL
jgi:putative hydrolase of the HAD superfamily